MIAWRSLNHKAIVCTPASPFFVLQNSAPKQHQRRSPSHGDRSQMGSQAQENMEFVACVAQSARIQIIAMPSNSILGATVLRKMHTSMLAGKHNATDRLAGSIVRSSSNNLRYLSMQHIVSNAIEVDTQPQSWCFRRAAVVTRDTHSTHFPFGPLMESRSIPSNRPRLHSLSRLSNCTGSDAHPTAAWRNCAVCAARRRSEL